MMRLGFAVAAFALAAGFGAAGFGAPAFAQQSFAQQSAAPPIGFYVRGDVGGGFGTNSTFKDTGPAAPNCLLCTGSFNASTGNSVYVDGALGYRLNPWIRTELSIGDLPSLRMSGRTAAGAAATGKANLSVLTGMASTYLDLNGWWPDMFGPFQPYLTAGIGAASVKLGATTGTVVGLAGGSLSGSSRTNFAWDLGAGIGYRIAPRWTVDLGYKFLDAGKMQSGTTASPAGAASFAVTPIRSNDLTVNVVTLGVRYAFWSPPASPPAPVATPAAAVRATPAPQRQMFLVFFDFDKSTLTPDGRKVVDAAAAAVKSGRSNVAVAGYTDLSGTAAYNMRLSERRADAVKAALVSDGVPAGEIAESWHGKENPRVPTADGVREPQNRRVEVTM